MKNQKTPISLTLEGIFDFFSTEEKARTYFESVRWANGVYCPRDLCGNADEKRIWKLTANSAKKIRAGLYQCAECKRQFTVTVGTIFEDTHIPLRKWLVAWYLLCASKKGISAHQIWRMLDLGSYRSAWYMMQRIRVALKDRLFTDKLSGVVESDETWVGGKAKGVGSGRYREKKTPVMTMIERGGRLRSKVMDRVTAATLRDALRQHVDRSAVLMTDDYGGYRTIGKEFSEHHAVNHLRGEYARGTAHVNTAEGFFANLKRGLHGVYHHVGAKYLDLYLGEFDHRFSHRKAGDGAVTLEGIKKVEGKRTTLSELKESS